MLSNEPVKNYYAIQQIRVLEQQAYEQNGISPWQLMQRAGDALFKILSLRWPSVAAIAVVAGKGNNAGDGYVLAERLLRAGKTVVVYAVTDASELSESASQARELFLQAGGKVLPFTPFCLQQKYQLVVDAIFGVGLNASSQAEYLQAIMDINVCGLPVLAVDIPSGLCGERGICLGTQCVQATATVTFIAYKQGFANALGRQSCGTLYLETLGLPAVLYQGLVPSLSSIDHTDWSRVLYNRPVNAHKKMFGHVLVIGGDYGMGGATILAAEAALKIGAGMVSVLTRAEHVSAILARRPEIMAHAFKNREDLEKLIAKADVLVVGPGLGQGEWAREILAVCAEVMDKPMVWDADALNWLSQQSAAKMHRDHWVLTPHPGEAARLLAHDPAAIEADRFTSVRALQQDFGGVVILKGAGTLVADQHPCLHVCFAGHPAMAVAGMGDVLSGAVAGLLAQQYPLPIAARLAVWVHATAGEQWALQHGERGLLASQVAEGLAEVINDKKISN